MTDVQGDVKSSVLHGNGGRVLEPENSVTYVKLGRKLGRDIQVLLVLLLRYQQKEGRRCKRIAHIIGTR